MCLPRFDAITVAPVGLPPQNLLYNSEHNSLFAPNLFRLMARVGFGYEDNICVLSDAEKVY